MLFIDKSVTTGTITAGTVSQVLDAAKTRVYVCIYNTSDTVMYINFGAVATSAHIPIPAGSKWESSPIACPKNSINIICATTGKTFCYLIA